jgi:prepilin-type N-terminal cleavage/methylation domain-containing protein
MPFAGRLTRLTIQQTTPGGAASQRAGFTLLEVMFAASVLAIAVAGVAGAMISAIRLDQVNGETAAAQQAARQIMEEVQSREFEQVFALFNSDPLDDPDGVGTAPGKDLPVLSLTPQQGDPDGFVAEVMFPAIDTVGGLQLREDFVDPELGMPGDLNNDRQPPDALDHSNDYFLLPVRVRIAWTGATGDRQLDLVTVLSER